MNDERASPPVTWAEPVAEKRGCSAPRRDECVTAYMPDAQWDLLQQSLKAHTTNGSEADVATSVVVEAGVLVRSPPASCRHCCSCASYRSPTVCGLDPSLAALLFGLATHTAMQRTLDGSMIANSARVAALKAASDPHAEPPQRDQERAS